MRGSLNNTLNVTYVANMGEKRGGPREGYLYDLARSIANSIASDTGFINYSKEIKATVTVGVHIPQETTPLQLKSSTTNVNSNILDGRTMDLKSAIEKAITNKIYLEIYQNGPNNKTIVGLSDRITPLNIDTGNGGNGTIYEAVHNNRVYNPNKTKCVITRESFNKIMLPGFMDNAGINYEKGTVYGADILVMDNDGDNTSGVIECILSEDNYKIAFVDSINLDVKMTANDEATIIAIVKFRMGIDPDKIQTKMEWG